MALKPHNDNKIELTKPDKIIFGIGATAYILMFLIEIYFNMDSEYSSSIVLSAVGIFLISKYFQQRKTKQFIRVKEKLVHFSMIAVGIFLITFAVLSLI